jgi:diguanylate cyclase (GGDEF)-like protein
VRPTPHLRLMPEDASLPHAAPELVDSYRRLADVFHEVLAEQSLDALLVRIADALHDLIPHDTLTIYEADEAQAVLTPVLARDQWVDEIMQTTIRFDEGITGRVAGSRQAALVNQAHLDPRVRFVPGTPIDPEALISIPLIARAQIKGVLNIYRVGEEAFFDEAEFELARRFSDAAALALDNAQIRARLEHQARTDSLTGLFNHRSFHERLLHALHDASRSHSAVAVLMLDIDDFKRVNDVHGHGVGDEVLQQLAETLRSSVRPQDVVCRLGGEEFAVIMSSCDGPDAVHVAERIVARTGQVEMPAVGAVTVSVGLARGPEHAMNPRELTACAEAAMMTAKAQGKNRIVLYDDESTERPDEPAKARDVRSIAHLKMRGITGRVAATGEALLVPNALECEFATRIPGTDELEESLVVVPLRYGSRVTGAIVISKLGTDQFDEDDVRLLEVLAGQASVALENARLYEQQRREAEGAKALLAFAGGLSHAQSFDEICTLTVDEGAALFGTGQASLWLADECVARVGEQLDEGASAPLPEGDGIHGRIVVGPCELDEDRERLLAAFAYQASVALQKARLYRKQREAAEVANALLDASREIATAESPDEVLRRSAEVTARVLGTSRAALWVSEHGEPHDLVARASFGYARKLDSAGERRVPGALAHEWLKRSEPFVLEPSDLAVLAGAGQPDVGRVVVAPLRLEGNRVGALTAAVGDCELDDRQLALLAGLAQQAKLAIESAEHYESLERTFVSTVEALANALEASDEYTSSHTRWITDMSLLVGRELRLDRESLKRLELAALFHDIGKIGIPSEILQKPGPLTDDELEIVREHPALGEKILAPIDRLADVRPIVRACHERWDGLGYPDGTAGTAIPVEARIVLVCDAFHAMTSDRPYRKRLPGDEAVHRLRQAAGSQFDPAVVEVFLRLYESSGVLPL